MERFFDSVSNQFKSLKLYYEPTGFLEFIKRVALKNVYGDQGVPGESVDHESIYDNITLWTNSWIKICGLNDESSFRYSYRYTAIVRRWKYNVVKLGVEPV